MSLQPLQQHSFEGEATGGCEGTLFTAVSTRLINAGTSSLQPLALALHYIIYPHIIGHHIFALTNQPPGQWHRLIRPPYRLHPAIPWIAVLTHPGTLYLAAPGCPESPGPSQIYYHCPGQVPEDHCPGIATVFSSWNTLQFSLTTQVSQTTM
jgi:hypothetical protein